MNRDLNYANTIMGLSYFEDAEQELLPKSFVECDWEIIKEFFMDFQKKFQNCLEKLRIIKLDGNRFMMSYLGKEIMEEYLDFAKQIAMKAGQIMLKYYKEDNGANYKFDQTIVTKADTEINNYLVNKVKEKYPTHSVDGEEEQFGKSDYVWVCDPVDGTAMYARHIPVAVFSLALVIDGVPKVGVVYDPFTDCLYSAIVGNGAFKNGEKIRVNDLNFDNMKSVAHFDIWPFAEYDIMETIKELGKKTYFVGIGSVIRACMCVASGEFCVAIFPGTKHKNCDIAAVKVIVEEAGGKVTDLFGNEQRYDCDINGAVISNGIVHEEVVEVLRKKKK